MGTRRTNACLVGVCPRTQIKICGREVECLIDTGSQVSLLPNKIVQSLGLEILKSPSLRLRAANGLEVNNIGSIWGEIKIWGQSYRDVGFVVTELNGVCIVGMNILKRVSNLEGKLGLGSRKEGRVEVSRIKVDHEKGGIDRDKEDMCELLSTYADLFEGKKDGCADVSVHRIRTVDN